MQFLPHLLCAAGALSLLFAYWGTQTAQGRRAFDEMAGMIPLGAGAIGLLLVLVGGVWLFVRSRSQ